MKRSFTLIPLLLAAFFRLPAAIAPASSESPTARASSISPAPSAVPSPVSTRITAPASCCTPSASVSAPVPSSTRHPIADVSVAAAADLRFAMDSLIKIFSAQPASPRITAVFGSSGNFFEQISNGAPFDIFFSADMEYPQKLRQQNMTLDEVKRYGTGQIVLWSSKTDPARAGMNTLLDPSLTKIAIANPAHAPYGKRAEESLKYYKIYDKIKDRLVIGENISQTAEFARSGAADIGIIALSLALSPAMTKQGGKYWLIPEQSHQPLRQGYVLLRHAKDNAGAAQFLAFIGSPVARNILHYFGFGDDRP